MKAFPLSTIWLLSMTAALTNCTSHRNSGPATMIKATVKTPAVTAGSQAPVNIAVRETVEVHTYAWPPRKIFGSSGVAAVPGPDDDLKQTVVPGDEEAPDPARDRRFRMFGAPAVTKWRPANSLLALREKLKVLAPNRDKRDDGMVGDAAHASRKSDHNPWVKDGAYGVVTAYDITHSPKTGCDCNKLVKSLLSTPGNRERLKYVIWNSQIYNHEPVNGVAAWKPRPYTGANHHDKHCHISVLPIKSLYDDTRTWDIEVK